MLFNLGAPTCGCGRVPLCVKLFSTVPGEAKFQHLVNAKGIKPEILLFSFFS